MMYRRTTIIKGNMRSQINYNARFEKKEIKIDKHANSK